MVIKKGCQGGIRAILSKEEPVKFFNTLGGYVTGVLAVWAAIFVVGYFLHGSTPGRPLLHVFGGFLLGMLSMYIVTRIYPRT
jgi:hypothetical protein